MTPLSLDRLEWYICLSAIFFSHVDESSWLPVFLGYTLKQVGLLPELNILSTAVNQSPRNCVRRRAPLIRQMASHTNILLPSLYFSVPPKSVQPDDLFILIILVCLLLPVRLAILHSEAEMARSIMTKARRLLANQPHST